MTLEAVIGLEVHVQLATRSKLFCQCPVAFGGEPNQRVCPVCTGQPGVLPVLNERALDLAIRAGLALGCTIPRRTKFDRKNYFYPDLPKGYQISQFDEPVAEHGQVVFERPDGSTGEAGITRAHMEEDAGKAIHPDGAPHSLVDLNRAGVPLIEIVGEPDLCSPADAAAFLIALRHRMRYAGVSDCDMEKGSMRCDANVSVRAAGSTTLGTKVEIKNMNSVRNVERALTFEIERQTALVEAGRGDCIVQETRSYRDDENVTVSMRRKEEADDYRYFPDPDLPPFDVSESRVEAIRAALPETYRARKARYQGALGLSEYDAGVLTEDRAVADWFEAVVEAGAPAKTAANWVQGEILAHLSESGAELSALRLEPGGLASLLDLIEQGQLSNQAGKKVLKQLLENGGEARAVAESLDLLQIQDDDVFAGLVDQVIQGETAIVEDYLGGKDAALNALLGRVMKECRGKGNPQVIRALLVERLPRP